MLCAYALNAIIRMCRWSNSFESSLVTPLTLCTRGNFDAFAGVCWLFFKINFFQSVLIWVKTAWIGYQQKTVGVVSSKERVERICTTIRWGEGLDFDVYLHLLPYFWYASTVHTGQCKRTGCCYNELVGAFFSTGGGVKGKKKSILVDFIIYL